MKPALVLIPLLAVLAFFLLRDPQGDGAGSSLNPGQSQALTPDEPASPAALAASQLQGEASEAERAAASGSLAQGAPGAPAGSEGHKAGGRTVSGRIVTAGGAPLGEARVRLVSGLDPGTGILILGELEETLREATSAGDGSFQIAQPLGKQGNQVVVELPGYQALRANVEQDQLGDLVLEPGLILRGTVLDDHGDPVAGARVIRSADPNDSPLAAIVFDAGSDLDESGALPGQGGTQTDDQGRFELAYERPGDIDLRVQHRLHPPQNFHTTGQVGDTLDETILLPKAASLIGRLEGLGDHDAGDIRVQAAVEGQGSTSEDMHGFEGHADRSVSLASDGTFELRGLRADSVYTVWATEGGESQWDADPCSDRVQADAGSSGVMLQYQLGATLSFRVVDAATGEAIEQLNVQHDWAADGGLDVGRMLFSGGDQEYPDGRVEIPMLRAPNPPSTLELSLAAAGYHKQELSPTIPAVGQVNLGEIRLAPTGKIRVLAETADGQPIEGAKVRLAGRSVEAPSIDRSEGEGTQVQAISLVVNASGPSDSPPDLDEMMSSMGSHAVEGVTDAQGICELSLPQGQEGSLSVSAKGFAPYKQNELVLPRSGVMEHAVVLTAGGQVHLQVMTADGQPAKRIRVEHYGEDKKLRSDSKGRIELDLVPAGLHHFRLAKPTPTGMAIVMVMSDEEEEESFEDWVSVNVVEGELSEGVLTLPPSGSLVGSVLSRGEPVGRARLKLTPVDESLSSRERAMRSAMGGLEGLGLDGGSLSERSDRQGDFEFDDVEVGLYTLKVTHSDWAMPQESEVRIQEGLNTLDLDLPLCVVSGQIKDAQGKPIGGAEVSVREDDGNANRVTIGVRINGASGSSGPGVVKTDEEGRYELRGVDQGKALLIEAKASGLAPAELQQPKLFRDEVRLDVDLVLVPAAQLTVVLGKAHKERDASMVMVRRDGGQPDMQRLVDGQTTFEGLAPGDWTVSLVSMGAGSGDDLAEEVTLASGESGSITLDGQAD